MHNGKNPEILKEHVDRCYHYFEELWEHKNFKAVFENFQKELAPELSDEGIKLFYSLIVNVIIFHDYGKINPRFQSITMKNTLRKWTVIDCLDGNILYCLRKFILTIFMRRYRKVCYQKMKRI